MTIGVDQTMASNSINRPRQEKVRESMYKVLLQLSAHIVQTDCAHCKAVVKGIRE